MTTSKRTTANVAYDVFGQKIRLLKTKLTSDAGHNRLAYSEIRSALANNERFVSVDTGDYGFISRSFERLSTGDVRYWSNEETATPVEVGQPYFRIGCHIFTLKMFNRILRAAGVRTTKLQTLKTFAAVAGN